MFRSIERNDWIVETVCLPIGLRVAPACGMSSQSIDKVVMSPSPGLTDHCKMRASHSPTQLRATA